MGPRTGGLAALVIVTVVCSASSAEAQEVRRDTVSNGVGIGAGSGAAAGALIGLLDEEICSPGACAYLGSVVGGLIGLLVDRKIGSPRLVQPGAAIDDRLWNGAVFGAVGGAGEVLLDLRRRCGSGPGLVQCTREGILLDLRAAAQWMAIVGLVIDAAIPSRLAEPRAHPRMRVSVNVRF